MPAALSVSEILASSDGVDTRAVATDLWPRRLIERRDGIAATLPQQVWWPQSQAEVQAIVHAARAQRRPIVPYGAGSGVCGGISPTTQTWVIDLKRMDRIIRIDPAAHEVVVEAGMVGDRLERRLNEAGFTLGHFPSSIYSSTVGGWFATRSAGQLSSRYGKIEDMVIGVWGVDGRGERIEAHVDDLPTGPGAVQMLCGSEGALAIVTQLRLRIEPMPSHRWLRGFTASSLQDGLTSMQRLLQSGAAPSVVRLYDPLDAALSSSHPPQPNEPDHITGGAIACAGIEDSGPHPDDETNPFEPLLQRLEKLMIFSRPHASRTIVGEALARPALLSGLLDRLDAKPRFIIGLEGSADDIHQRLPVVRRSLVGATDLGAAPGERWLSHRHRVSYRMSKVFAAGGWVDTCETACGWAEVLPLYRAMREALRDLAVVMCHFSHAYIDGCSLYFTFAGGGTTGSEGGPRSSLSRYDLAWERALLVLRKHGAALSHHHGIGRLKAHVARSDGTMTVLAAMKRALDPDGILNPGVLGVGGP
jgi:alkyldihydroxyacetonephosphate synthase